jgi:hypothetical protein
MDEKGEKKDRNLDLDKEWDMGLIINSDLEDMDPDQRDQWESEDSTDMKDRVIVKDSTDMEDRVIVKDIGVDGTVIGMKDRVIVKDIGVMEDMGVITGDIGADGAIIGIIIGIIGIMDGGVGAAIRGHIIGHGVNIGVMDIMDIMGMADIDGRS